MEKGDDEKVIRFCKGHFSEKLESEHELSLNQFLELKNNNLHPRYKHIYDIYLKDI
tara:strand:+ start:555 stop:722 length:168 start_codon:yes stop_codon:yes gene_type:complete